MRWLRYPAVHMALIGGLVFAATTLRGGALFEHRPRIVVASHRLDLMLETFAADNFRPATREERAAMIDALVDEEVLYNYALLLGMDQHPAARRRLAQIARFVEANPHEATEDELARTAIELGLHRDDLVVRRILVDSARRLIRGVVLVQEPRPQLLEEYLAAHPQELRRPASVRISQVLVNGFKWPDTYARARDLLAKIRTESLDLEAALTLGDEGFVAPSLPFLTEKAMATKFGPEFAAEVIAAPVPGWIGPVASRYGHHLVYVHERHDAYVPSLQEIRVEVKERLLQKLADDYLALRLKELRLEFEIVTPERAS